MSRSLCALVWLAACAGSVPPWESDFVAPVDHRSCEVFCQYRDGYSDLDAVAACRTACALAALWCDDEDLIPLFDCQLAYRQGWADVEMCIVLEDDVEVRCKVEFDPEHTTTSSDGGGSG